MAPTVWGKVWWDLTCCWLEPLWAPGVARPLLLGGGGLAPGNVMGSPYRGLHVSISHGSCSLGGKSSVPYRTAFSPLFFVCEKRSAA